MSLDRRSISITNKNTEAEKKMILNNHRITIRDVADHIGLSFGFFMHVLGMKRAAAKIVPEMLSFFRIVSFSFCIGRMTF